jgi:hypothetical protein
MKRICAAASLVAPAILSTSAAAGDLPDPALTPGAVLTTDAAAVCTLGYAKSVRHVSGKVKARVYREYGIAHHALFRRLVRFPCSSSGVMAR